MTHGAGSIHRSTSLGFGQGMSFFSVLPFSASEPDQPFRVRPGLGTPQRKPEITLQILCEVPIFSPSGLRDQPSHEAVGMAVETLVVLCPEVELFDYLVGRRSQLGIVHMARAL